MFIPFLEDSVSSCNLSCFSSPFLLSPNALSFAPFQSSSMLVLVAGFFFSLCLLHPLFLLINEACLIQSPSHICFLCTSVCNFFISSKDRLTFKACFF
uniref:Uncharacterized protein n=1 Tax=Rhizophora mucronata TaxID=61149 RepID=A0A2P2QU39_RHIMU